MINGFRGLNFEHDFSSEQYIVLTGVNGSGKTTIIESIELLLKTRANSIQDSFALQATSSKAIFEICIEISDNEISYLADRIYASQPERMQRDEISKQLKLNIFINNKYSRKIEIDRPQLAWSVRENVREYLNGNLINIDFGMESLISPNGLNIMQQLFTLRFDNLESINMQFSNRISRPYSVEQIFSSQNNDGNLRISKTNVSLNSLLESLLPYGNQNYEQIDELLAKYNEMLSPIVLKRGDNSRDFIDIVLVKPGLDSSYTIHSASSGQKKAIALITLKYLWSNSPLKPIIMLDEPENSMHPGLITRLFNSLSELGTENDQPCFIISTHSPEVVAANPNNTYRIITTNNKARLEKIKGLEARANVLSELGVHFHLDYVAQKLVFVESSQNKTDELNDEEAYQRLIDPQKEEVVFFSVGSNVKTEEKYNFQKELLAKLGSLSNNLVYRLKDRDNNEYDENQHTPFKHIEYIYIANHKVLAQAISDYMQLTINENDIHLLFEKSDYSTQMDLENYKKVWQKILAEYSIRGKLKGVVQAKIVDTLYLNPNEMTEPIKILANRYRNVPNSTKSMNSSE